jgi:hypothetical protein
MLDRFKSFDVSQVNGSKYCPSYRRFAEVGESQVGSDKGGCEEVGLNKMGLSEVNEAEIGSAEIGFSEVSGAKYTKSLKGIGIESRRLSVYVSSESTYPMTGGKHERSPIDFKDPDG